jgi:Xaa-Pro aminopeptidase
MREIFLERRDKLREKLIDHDLDGYLVLHPPNRFYLSGFELHDPQCNESAGCLLIGKNGSDWFCTDPRYQQEAKTLWDEKFLFIYKEQRIQQLTDFFAKQGFTRLGFETRIMSHEMHAIMHDCLQLRPFNGLVEELRSLKDEFEIECLNKSCLLNHQAFILCQELVQPGLMEKTISWEIEKFFRENEASELAFPCIVAFGPHAALPHHLPGDTVLTSESPVLIDIGARLHNYCSDQTRTLWIGDHLPEYYLKTRDLVQEAQKRAIDSIRPGVKMSEVFHQTKEFFGKFGLDSHFIHSLGHGVGLETHEYPGLGPRNENAFQEGMVVTIEPGLYFPEWGGVRWENMGVVRQDGLQVL